MAEIKVIFKASILTSNVDRVVREALDLKKKYPDANIRVRVSA